MREFEDYIEQTYPACIVVVAKCPIPGQSKTRLAPSLTERGAAFLAQAMLGDVLTAISDCEDLREVGKVVLYAPPTEKGYAMMKKIVHDELGLTNWRLRPVLRSETNLRSSQLTAILTDALIQMRQQTTGPVVFMGMDAPEVPLSELIRTCRPPQQDEVALLCPSADGGYGLLSVPNFASDRIFEDVTWSHPLTAISQIKALTDRKVPVVMGPLMHDIDEIHDVEKLCARIQKRREKEMAKNSDEQQEEVVEDLREEEARRSSVLKRPSLMQGSHVTNSDCKLTRQALIQLGALPPDPEPEPDPTSDKKEIWMEPFELIHDIVQTFSSPQS